MATKKPKETKPPIVDADPPEDYYDTFHGRGQDEQDLHDALKASKPPRQAGQPSGWPFPIRDPGTAKKSTE